jgi:hypothetical protein
LEGGVLELIVGILFLGAVAFFVLKKKKDSDSLEDSTEAKLSTQRRKPHEKNSDEDAWEGTFWEADNPLPVNAELAIDYRDGNGTLSKRNVTVRNFDTEHYGGIFIAHCHLRNATRSFRFDRIRACIDRSTGEVVSDIRSYLLSLYEHSPDFTLKKLVETDYDTLRILLYVAKADGTFTKKEKEVFVEVCRAISSDSRITIDSLEGILADIEHLSLTAFKRAVGRIGTKDKAVQQQVLEAAQKIIQTQKTVHAVEQEALDYMSKKLGD